MRVPKIVGRTVADKLAQSGVHVMVVGRNVERGERTIAEYGRRAGKPISSRQTFAMLRAPVRPPATFVS